jgi:miniconductance mechanosensitive channel
LEDYLDQKSQEIEAHNTGTNNPDVNANIRRLTNVGMFRAYIYQYLQNHPQIRKDMTLLVRQLNPTSDGLPIEIYCFTNTTEWRAYEDIQADLLDHLLALAPDFGLRAFQHPSGQDLKQLAKSSVQDSPRP